MEEQDSFFDYETSSMQDGYIETDNEKLWEKLATNTFQIREKILEELLNTERNYVNDLRLTIGLFLQPTRVDEQLLSEADILVIFMNIEMILAVNTQLLDVLEDLFKDRIDGQIKISHIFAKILDFLKVYAFYCSNYRKAIAHSAERERANPIYAKFLKDMSDHPACNGLYLKDFLIKPVQRLCKYPTLFRELEKFTPHNHDDYIGVKTLTKKVQEAAEVSNRISAGQENMEKLVLFNETVLGFEVILI